MGLSYNTVQKAYEVLNALEQNHIPELRIPSWPEDMAQWNWQKKENPPLNVVLGWDKKHDDGWENLIFFTKNPSKELTEAFDKLNADAKIGNTSINGPYQLNESIWCIGWF